LEFKNRKKLKYKIKIVFVFFKNYFHFLSFYSSIFLIIIFRCFCFTNPKQKRKTRKKAKDILGLMCISDDATINCSKNKDVMKKRKMLEKGKGKSKKNKIIKKKKLLQQ